jgi:hypothetical protein
VRRLLACALLLAACKSAPQTRPEVDVSSDARTFYPLAVGNTWTYELSGAGDSGRRETIRIVGRDGAWFLDDHRGRFRYESDGVRDADRYLLRTPVKAGAEWKSVEQLVVQKFELVTTDASVVTQAGTFTGCAVVRNEQPLAAPHGDKSGRFVTEWTYAPRVGLVQLRTSTLAANGSERPQTKLLLVAFRLQ